MCTQRTGSVGGTCCVKMVVTRRGVRMVESPTKTNQDESSVASELGTSSRRRTRRTMAQPEEQQPPLEYVSDTQEAEGEVTSGTTQEQKPAEENQPDDIHDADVSDSESCCSVVSDAQGLSTRLNTRRPPKTLRSGTEVVSKAESCAPVSATPRRSTRSQKKENPLGCDSEAESYSSVMSASKSGGTCVLTRSQKKTVLTKSASHTEDTELSEHDSARDDLRMSTLRKSTRSRRAKPLEPVPIDFDDSGDASSSSVSRRTPGRKAKAIPTEISKDDKPAPSPRRVIRTRVKDATVRVTSDSESDIAGYSSVGSPSGTPCSSRTGSASRNCAVIITRSLHVDAKHASSPLRAEAQTPSQGDAPMSDAIETEEKVEVEKHEATVIVTSEEGQTSLLAEEADEDKTLIAMEEGEKEDKVEEDGGVTVFAPAALKAVENADSARPSVVVTEAECPDTEMTEEISPVVKDQSETVALKGSVVVSEEREEDAKSDLVVVDDTVKTTRADTVSLTVSEVAEADTTEAVDEENDELLNATEDQTCTEQSVKVTAELDGNVAENAEKEKATELDVPCEQIVKVTLCEAPKEEVLDEISAHADSGIQDAAEEDQEPNGPDPTSLKSVQVTDEEDQPIEVDPTDQQEEVESLACGSSSVDLKGSAGWQCKDGSEQPTGSGTLRKPAAVSLLDSSDDEEEEDNSDVCSLTMEPAAGQEASESEEEDENDLAARAKPKAMAQIQSSDGLFVIDTQPGVHSSQMFHMEERPAVEEGDGPERGDEMMEEAKGIEEEEEFVDEEEDEEDEDGKVLFTSRNTALEKLSCGIDPGLRMKELGGLYVSFDGGKSKKVSKSQNSLKDHKHLDELMKKSVIVPDFEKKHSIPPYKESLNATKLKRRVERQKTTGDGWFNMKAPELTEELKNDLKALQMRSAMDPKRFYKKNDREGFAKYVQVGTVVDSPVDFYNSRIPKKERKRTIVEELMADAEFRSYNKRKYQEIMSERAAQLAGKKHWKKKSKSK